MGPPADTSRIRIIDRNEEVICEVGWQLGALAGSVNNAYAQRRDGAEGLNWSNRATGYH
jgi:hypothetical protein